MHLPIRVSVICMASAPFLGGHESSEKENARCNTFVILDA